MLQISSVCPIRREVFACSSSVKTYRNHVSKYLYLSFLRIAKSDGLILDFENVLGWASMALTRQCDDVHSMPACLELKDRIVIGQNGSGYICPRPHERLAVWSQIRAVLQPCWGMEWNAAENLPLLQITNVENIARKDPTAIAAPGWCDDCNARAERVNSTYMPKSNSGNT